MNIFIILYMLRSVNCIKMLSDLNNIAKHSYSSKVNLIYFIYINIRNEGNYGFVGGLVGNGGILNTFINRGFRSAKLCAMPKRLFGIQ